MGLVSNYESFPCLWSRKGDMTATLASDYTTPLWKEIVSAVQRGATQKGAQKCIQPVHTQTPHGACGGTYYCLILSPSVR